MKVYKLNKEVEYSKFDHPEDMQFIMNILEEKGEVLVSTSTIELLYYEFSNKCACGWRIVDGESVTEFAEWLDEYEM